MSAFEKVRSQYGQMLVYSDAFATSGTKERKKKEYSSNEIITALQASLQLLGRGKVELAMKRKIEAFNLFATFHKLSSTDWAIASADICRDVEVAAVRDSTKLQGAMNGLIIVNRQFKTYADSMEHEVTTSKDSDIARCKLFATLALLQALDGSGEDAETMQLGW